MSNSYLKKIKKINTHRAYVNAYMKKDYPSKKEKEQLEVGGKQSSVVSWTPILKNLTLRMICDF